MQTIRAQRRRFACSRLQLAGGPGPLGRVDALRRQRRQPEVLAARSEINKDTIGKLTDRRGDGPRPTTPSSRPIRPRAGAVTRTTPLMVKGVLYTVTSLGQIAAIESRRRARRSGRSIPATGRPGGPAVLGYVHRGLAYWSDGKIDRLLLGTHDAYLISVDAKTGALDKSRSAKRAGST